MKQKLVDALNRIAQQRHEILSTVDPVEKEEKAQNALVDMLSFASLFLGDDVIRAAYGSVEGADREKILTSASMRTLMASIIFARMPDDEASLERIASEAMAASRGDAPVMFAQDTSRKRSHRVTMAKFGALAWDAYLDGLGITSVARQSAIAVAFGLGWDTIWRWIKPARALLGDEYVDYHLSKARVEGMRRRPFGHNQSYFQAKVRGPVSWEQALTTEGERFRTIQRANKGI